MSSLGRDSFVHDRAILREPTQLPACCFSNRMPYPALHYTFRITDFPLRSRFFVFAVVVDIASPLRLPNFFFLFQHWGQSQHRFAVAFASPQAVELPLHTPCHFVFAAAVNLWLFWVPEAAGFASPLMIAVSHPAAAPSRGVTKQLATQRNIATTWQL
ncbi:hypothetical protein FOMA001_g12152 [Fusarium oxysporum f. sp. matthiolae]|nr:hypothetical protein FOMA001_g12152 [Fusarium oxysporum f. sp. matthiolae]